MPRRSGKPIRAGRDNDRVVAVYIDSDDCHAGRSTALDNNATRIDEVGFGRPRDAIVDGEPSIFVNELRPPTIPVTRQEAEGVVGAVLVEHTDDCNPGTIAPLGVDHYRVLLDAGRDAPTSPEIDHVWSTAQTCARDPAAVNRSQRERWSRLADQG